MIPGSGGCSRRRWAFRPPAEVGAVDVLDDPHDSRMVLQIAGETVQVESKRLGMNSQISQARGPLMLESGPHGAP